MTYLVHSIEQIPAAILDLKVKNLGNLIGFVHATQAYHRDVDVFRKVIENCIGDGAVSSVELADAFEVNVATVSRWKNGKNVPHIRERPIIIDWLEKKLSADLAEERRKHDELIEIEKKSSKIDRERGNDNKMVHAVN